jgi:hypothetical protein
VHVPKLYEGFVRSDSSGRVFLVDPLNGGQKHTFLFKLKDGNILLDDKPEQTQADASTKVHGEETTAAQAAVVDEDVEFPSVSADGDVNDAPWIM